MNDYSQTASGGRMVPPNSMIACVFLAFLSTAGLFYINIMPAIVCGLIDDLSYTARQAGLVASADVYGAATGALLIVFIVKRISWRPTSYALLGVLILIVLLSMLIVKPEALIAFRYVHGCVGGALVGAGFSVIARTLHPDRTLGVLLFIQFGLGGLGNLYIPRLVPVFGTNVLFISLITFSIVTTLMVLFLDRYPVNHQETTSDQRSKPKIPLMPITLVLASIFLFQFGNNGLFAFIIGLGKWLNLSLEFITTTLAASGWIGILGALFVIAIYTRYGRTIPSATAMIAIIEQRGIHYSQHGTNKATRLSKLCRQVAPLQRAIATRR